MSLKRKRPLSNIIMEGSVSGNVDYFKEEVNRFTTIDSRIKDITERIKPLTDELKELKRNKTEIKKEICTFMDRNNLEKCELREQGSTLVYRKRRTVIPITKDTIKEDLKRFFLNCDYREFQSLNVQEKADRIHDFIYKEREYRYTDILQNKKN